MIKYETDSRKVKKGQFFVAIKGHTVDGHNYINDAIKNGASAIVCEREIKVNVPTIIVNNSEEYLNNKLKEEYSNDLKDLKVIGVTGTNGKTTTCYLTYQLLQIFKVKACYIGTIGFYYQDEVIELENTTPDILNIYKLFYHAKELGCTHVVMEVSSHALSYNRLNGIDLDIAAFTNLTEDHLDYYHTMDNYLKAKLLIIKKIKKDGLLIVNSDDEASKTFTKEYQNNLSIGFKGDYQIDAFDTNSTLTNLTFSFKEKTYKVTTPLTSKFNVYNYLTALAIINNLGFQIEDILKVTKDIKAPKGRCETLKIKKGVTIIDYAHTPDAVEKVINAYLTLKKNKIITIIGCGGDRDPLKRPIMGKIATNLSDYVIFTNDNPRCEDPKLIMDDIIKGVNKNNYEIEYDRKKAIKKAIDLMEENDILLVLGKGHENYQIIGTTKYHLDDSEEVLKYN